MEHFYQNIDSENWFNYEEIYKSAVQKFDSGSIFVEVGTWKGMSACFMAVEIINSKKNIRFDCVDTWQIVETSKDIDANLYDNLYETFLNNISPVRNIINVNRSISWDAANHYKNESLDFVFIDAGHEYENVKKDLESWYPKVKSNGGIIAGHDYHNNGICKVKSAVDDFFNTINKEVNQKCSCWLCEK